MKKYVVIIILESWSVRLYEPKTTVLTISESYLNKIDEEFVMDFFNRDKLLIGRVSSFSVICYSYGEYSKEKSSQIEKAVEKEVARWNEEVDELVKEVHELVK
ncbi:MAG TPA: hypothetical protein VFD16_03070 [Candidatus Saccharimonadales bacterium]|nr:hypothetical protein [Candidatus Saccharimonadales bacterium]